MMTLKMEFLFLPFYGTGRLWPVLDGLCHSIKAQAHAEEHKRENKCQE
jgi:hypothetical protein